MLYVKKYFTEGLIQVAILLSLCGMRVDVGLEPYLPPSWQEMILGPTSGLTQTQFHNLHNSLEDGHGLHPKNVDVDSFFTARRLLGWVHSLDRLQVPPAGLETWLVQREPDPLPMGCPDWPTTLERAPAGLERDQNDIPLELRAGPGTLQEGEEADELSEDGRRGALEPLPTEPQLSSIMPTDNQSLDLELHWQDLFTIMEPENKDFDMRTINHSSDSRPSEILWSEAQNQDFNNLDSVMVDQEVNQMETSPQHGWMGSLRCSGLEQVLLPLTPCAEFDEHISRFSNFDINTLQSPPHHTDLLPENLSEDFCMGLNAEYNSSTFNMNLLAQDLEDSMEASPCLQFTPNPENLDSFDVNFNLRDLTPSTSATSLEKNDSSQDVLKSPSNIFLIEKEEDFEDEDNFHSPLGDLLDDVATLDEIRLLDLALDKGFSTDMAVGLGEEFYPDHEIPEQKTGNYEDCSGSAVTEEQSQPRRSLQDVEDEADSDSGLSLDFSHSPASPCVSVASSYSSSTSSSSDSSSPCVSAVESPDSNEQKDDAEEGLAGLDMELEVTIKQEQEEEMGAVGGWYPEDGKKVFPANYGDHKLFNGFSWQEHVDHDHTYNQPWSSGSAPSLDKMPTKHVKSSPRHDDPKPYCCSFSRHISKKNVWSRDERRAKAPKIPFSNELIVNLPVEEFNELLTNSKLNEDQVALIRDIRRRGKNKLAAQNCRKRKLDVLLGLEEDVSILRRHRARLLREKQEALKKLQEVKGQLGMLYQEVFSNLKDENGRPLDSSEYLLDFGPSGRVTVTSQQQGALLPLRGDKRSKKQRDKKK
ncbi:Nuclear factor erythroid 2-related factor 1 [Channa argus]|uniref:Endoplasmic reticulum membrane sensor NFE2L1 n=1 Tax=Channa argus TaxID=215402 RepID=A0A6G1QAH8_CHAAH|nr:Nuclear factor erythroid 2-related factor 1 [Channa argus]